MSSSASSSQLNQCGSGGARMTISRRVFGLTAILAGAVGLAILTEIKARLAAIPLTEMWVIFGLLVLLPTLIDDPHNHANWTEHDANLLLIGAAWCLADWLGRTGPQRVGVASGVLIRCRIVYSANCHRPLLPARISS